MSNWQLIGRQEFDCRQRIDFLLCCVVGLFVVSITEGSMGCGVWMEEECNNMILKDYVATMDTRTWKEEEEEEEEKEDAQRQGCTISGRLVVQTSVFCTVEPNIFSISTVVFFSALQKCASFHQHGQQTPGEVQRSLRNCRPSL